MNNKNISAARLLSLASINTILAALFVVQLVLVWLSLQPDKEITEQAVTFFTSMQSDHINDLSITDNEGNSIHFFLSSEGKWQIKQNNDSPAFADHQAVIDILDKLINLQAERLVALTESSHIRLQVDETVFARKVAIRDKNGDKQILFFGTSPGRQTSHVRSGESEKVYQVKGLTSWELSTDSDAWRTE